MAQRTRSVVGLIVLASLGGVGWLWYRKSTEKDRVIAEQQRVITQLAQKLDRAWSAELVADMRVDELGRGEDGRPWMKLTFVEYQPGTERPRVERRMTLPGEEFYVDALVVQFERKFVEAGDGLRGKSLLVFRRAFGDRQEPREGVPLYRQAGEGPVPEFAQVDAQPSEFERGLWVRFWDYASDPKKAAQAGVRVAQGEAPHVRAVKGQVYKLTLRASGGLEITPRLPAALLEGAPATNVASP